MPAVYQPRVKDLEAPDFSSMLSGEEGLCSLETEAATIAVPVVEPVEVSIAVARPPLFAALCVTPVGCLRSVLLVSLHHMLADGLLPCPSQWLLLAVLPYSRLLCCAPLSLLCITAGDGSSGDQQPHCPQGSAQHSIQPQLRVSSSAHRVRCVL
jgi:hypothetical protein